MNKFRRLTAFILIGALLSLMPTYSFADKIDWSSMTNEEINAEIDMAKRELISRDFGKDLDQKELLTIKTGLQFETAEDTVILDYDVGKYHIALLSRGGLWKSNTGEYILIVTYTWTNNSEQTSSALANFICNAYQDGYQLDTYFFNEQTADYARNIRPGVSQQVQTSFVLRNDSSPVEFELYALTDLFKENVAYHVFGEKK